MWGFKGSFENDLVKLAFKFSYVAMHSRAKLR